MVMTCLAISELIFLCGLLICGDDDDSDDRGGDEDNAVILLIVILFRLSRGRTGGCISVFL